LNIKYKPGKAPFERSQHENNIVKMIFSNEYQEYYESEKITYNFNLNFDPDTFIEFASV